MWLYYRSYICITIVGKLDCLTENFKLVYMETRCQPVKDQWPPNQPTTIVNVALIHHEGEQTQQELIDMSMRNVFVVEKLSFHHPRVTKRIIDIFRLSHKRILIEGVPGIGKTVLVREIAYCWASGEILIDKKLFLLFIRDPDLHHVESIKDLVHYLNNDYLSDSEAEVAVDELRKSKGSGIVFVIDGYDECPCDSKLKGFVDKLIEKKFLPMCMVVITSRPTASLLLRHLVDQRIEILGLAKKEQEQYILESLKGSPEMITELQEYLKKQPIINSLLYIPLHLAILLFLFKQSSLPETLTEMNEYFIVHTIYRHLTKQRQLSFMKIDTIADLPEPELTTVYQLSKLAYKGLHNSQLVFTYDEIKEVCPKVDDIPGAISGFGLLQTVACYHQKGAGKALSLNFVHFTMQEYLAALHVSTLPSKEQASLIERFVLYRQYNFMWIMYGGIVGSHSTTLTDIVIEHSQHWNNDTMVARRNLFLFQCYLEQKDDNLISKALTFNFRGGNINLSKVTLLPHHIMSLTAFMIRSTTQWKSLNLDSCYIGNNGMSILANFFVDFKKVTNTIKHLNLRNNNLTSLWGTCTVNDQNYANACSELLQSVEDLDISFNLMCDRDIRECLKINGALCKLSLSHNNITDEGVKKITEVIQVNTTLQKLNVSRNRITDKGAKVLSKAIQVNTTLQNLNISKNWISKEGVMGIVEACTINRTLHKLMCTHNNLSKSGLAAINEYIREENAVQIFDASWNSIATKNGQLAINTTFQLLDISKATFQLSDVQQKLHSGNDIKELWFADEITELKYRREFLLCCTEENEHLNIQSVNLSDMAQIGIISDCLKLNKKIAEISLCSCRVSNEGIKILVRAVEISTTLQKLEISNNTISDDGILPISNFLKTNHTLCKLNVSCNDLRDEGIMKFLEAICVNTTLKDLNMSRNRITDEGANELSKAIQVNKTLQELNVSKNWISKEGVMRIVKACTINRTLHKLVCTHNNLSKSGLAAINEYIREENAVQLFDASWNNTIGSKYGDLAINTIFQLLDISKATFQLSDVQQKLQSDIDIQQELWSADEINELKYRREFLLCCTEENEHLNIQSANLSDMAQIGIISDCLKLNKKITEISLCSCRVSNKGIKILVRAVEISTTLQKLEISNNTISDDGILPISNFLKTNHTLCKLNVSCNYLRDEGIMKFSEAICVNTTLKDLNMSRNRITDEGANELSKAIQVNKTLQELNVSKNWISKEGVMRIVEACTINRTLHKLVCTHNNLSKSGLAVINEYIREENAVQLFDASWNNTIGGVCGQLAINTIFQLLDISKATFQLSDVQQKLQSDIDIQQELWSADEITELKYRREFLLCCTEENEHLNIQSDNLSDMAQIGIISDCLKLNKKITEIRLCGCQVSNEGIQILVRAVEISTTLQKLEISNNTISDDGILSISNFLKTNHTLCKLNVSGNDLRDKGIMKFSEAICVNTTLKDLNMSRNRITDEGANELSKAIEVNKTLQKLNVSKNWISKKGVMRIVEACTINRTLQKLVCTHNNLSKSGLAAINEYIREENAVQLFDASWNNTIGSKYGDLAINTIFQLLDISKATFQLSDVQQKLQSDIDIQQELWSADEINELKYRREFLLCCTEENEHLNIQSANLSDMAQIGIISDCLKLNKKITEISLCSCRVSNEGIKILVRAVEISTTLQKLEISNNTISDDGILPISNFLKTNHTLCKLNVSCNDLRDEGIMKFSEAICVNTTLKDLNMSRNRITDEGANELSKAIQVNKTLQELNVSKNWISKEGVMRIVEACTINRTLHKLVCTHNNLSKSGLAVINEYIREENAVQLFDASWNNTIGGVCGQLAINTIFQLLDISKATFQLSDVQQKLQSDIDIQQELWCADEITELKYRREFLLCCTEENEHLNIQSANLSDMAQIGIISDCLKLNKKITEISLCSCQVSNEGIQILVRAVEISTTLQKLEISNNTISDDGILSISNFLKTNHTLCKLNVSGNDLRDERIMKFSEAICVNTTLKDLNMSRNRITDEGANELSKAIQVNKTLQELNVSKNWISKEGVMRIVEACTINRTLHKLVCTHNNLSKSGLAAINEYIREENAVQLFDASWNNTIGGVCGQLAINTIFQLLDISKATFQLSDVQQKLQSDIDIQQELWCADEITELKYRREFLLCCTEENEHLSIQSANLSDMAQIGIISDCLKLNKKITEIRLCSCRVSNEGIKILVRAVEISTTLQKLEISNNTISDDGILPISNFLKTNHTLCKLNVSGNDLRDEGIMKFSEAICVNTTLKDLNMSRNRITDEGANELSKAIQVNKTLQELNVSKNWISKEGVMRIVEACTINRTLHKLVCTHNNLSKSGLAAINEYIREENAVQLFDASWNNTIGGVCGQLAINTIFQLLDISKATFQLSDVQQKLQSDIDIQQELWRADEITELKYRREFLLCCTEENEHLNIQSANLSDMAQIGIISDCLKLMKKITEIRLCSCRVSNEGIKILVRAVEISTTLQKLEISYNTISDDGMLSISDFLKTNHTLCKLNVSGNDLRDEGIMKFSEAICVNTTLKDLNMSRNRITDEGANELSKAIQVNKTLQELNVSKNWISKEGVMRIVEACTINRTLHKLVCTHNNLSKSGLAAINEYIREENAVQLFDASWNNTIGGLCGRLAINTIFQLLDISKATFQLSDVQQKLQSDIDIQQQLWYPGEINELKYRREFLLCCTEENEHLNIQSANLSDMAQIGIISDCLKLNKKITEIRLCSCRVSNEGIKILVQAVEISTTLQKLEISYNTISDDGILSISNFLKTNHTLCKLNVSGNDLMDEGIMKFSEAICVNTTLKDLNMSRNRITDKGANEISKAIQVNTTLQELNLSKNWISKEGVMRIVEACTINRTLHKLVCTHNNLSKSGLAAINEYVRKENVVQNFYA